MASLRKYLQALVSLQQQYVQLVEDEDPDHMEALEGYMEVASTLKKRMKSASAGKHVLALLLSTDFHQALSTGNGSLYIPLLDILNSAFKYHSDVARLLFSEHQSSLTGLLRSVSLHLVWAAESLEDEEGLFNKKETRFIADVSMKLFKNVTDARRDVLSYVAEEFPEVVLCFTQFSTVFSCRDQSRLALLLTEEAERIEEFKDRVDAASVIQAWWKGILQRRRWKTMRKGFGKLQRLQRKRLLVKERSLMTEFRDSEMRFETHLDHLTRKRRQQERSLAKISRLPPNKLPNYFLRQRDLAARRIQSFWRSKHAEPESRSPEERHRRETAALVIQSAARRWMVKKQRYRPVWTKSMLLQPQISEERARELQEKIDYWQVRNKVGTLSPSELQELHQKAQLRFAQFNQTRPKQRLQQQKIEASLAKATTLIQTLASCAPALTEYNHRTHWVDFHSLPLHLATKARLDHKNALRRLEYPRWKKVLEES